MEELDALDLHGYKLDELDDPDELDEVDGSCAFSLAPGNAPPDLKFP